jgi:hypothetical protein
LPAINFLHFFWTSKPLDPDRYSALNAGSGSGSLSNEYGSATHVQVFSSFLLLHTVSLYSLLSSFLTQSSLYSLLSSSLTQSCLSSLLSSFVTQSSMSLLRSSTSLSLPCLLFFLPPSVSLPCLLLFPSSHSVFPVFSSFLVPHSVFRLLFFLLPVPTLRHFLSLAPASSFLSLKDVFRIK